MHKALPANGIGEGYCSPLRRGTQAPLAGRRQVLRGWKQNPIKPAMHDALNFNKHLLNFLPRIFPLITSTVRHDCTVSPFTSTGSRGSRRALA